MRKYLKDNILEILSTMFEAHSIIDSLIKKQDLDRVHAILADCQNAAVQIGTAIDESEGDGTKTVKLLEQYCEEVYRSALELSENNASPSAEAAELLLGEIKSSVENDIETRLEIVFLPYKFSMWDSLESVWKSACDDPRCNVSVIPIPYYDKNSDGSTGKRHYEGDDFSGHIPVVSYKSVNLSELRPDVIYIHNPYDEYNFVTTVDPQYYTSRLKEYTSKLVYIPYFVLREIDPQNAKAVSKIEHFIKTPAIINADTIAVQSEPMKKIYLDTMSKMVAFQNEKHLENHVLGFGSPKFDKVVSDDRANYPLPEQWNEIIAGRKVILLNSSLNALLKHGERQLSKLEKTFDKMKNINNAVLWWRPHPLTEATLASMRPELASLYSDIVDKFLSEKIGIFDDTSDLHRAIACSDMYYGDLSSVTWLFGATGKPVMLIGYKIHPRSVMEPNNWFSRECEENDLADWIEGKQKWRLKKQFSDFFGNDGFDGKVGFRIHHKIIADILSGKQEEKS